MVYKLANVIKKYDQRTVLEIGNLDVAEGTINALLGPNGAGKSTLLSMMAFLDIPSAGELHFMGKRVKGSLKSLKHLRRQVVMVDQSPLLFSGSVIKNVEFGMKVRGVHKEERMIRAQRALDLVGMASFAGANAQRLSGGETKRVALARALVVEPRVLLLDEPTANVDVENQKIILDIIDNINTRDKTTILFSTHQFADGQQLADRSLLLKNGKLVNEQQPNTYLCRVLACKESKIQCNIPSSEVQINTTNDRQYRLHDELEIKLDQAKIKLLSGDEVGGKENVYSGQVVTISRQNGKVRYELDFGIKATKISSYEEYTKNPVILGESVNVHLPQEALSLRKLT